MFLCQLFYVIYDRHEISLIAQVIEHMKLDRAESPCEMSEDYSFTDCINRRIALNVGCQTFWTNFPGLARCRNMSSIQRYISEYFRHSFHMEDTEIKLSTDCPAPCHFTEYRVGNTVVFISCVLTNRIKKLVGDPIILKVNLTMLEIFYATRNVIIEKEEFSFPSTSLVSECCGILGMFIGFNFLMIWDFLVVLVHKISGGRKTRLRKPRPAYKK